MAELAIIPASVARTTAVPAPARQAATRTDPARSTTNRTAQAPTRGQARVQPQDRADTATAHGAAPAPRETTPGEPLKAATRPDGSAEDFAQLVATARQQATPDTTAVAVDPAIAAMLASQLAKVQPQPGPTVRPELLAETPVDLTVPDDTDASPSAPAATTTDSKPDDGGDAALALIAMILSPPPALPVTIVRAEAASSPRAAPAAPVTMPTAAPAAPVAGGAPTVTTPADPAKAAAAQAALAALAGGAQIVEQSAEAIAPRAADPATPPPTLPATAQPAPPLAQAPAQPVVANAEPRPRPIPAAAPKMSPVQPAVTEAATAPAEPIAAPRADAPAKPVAQRPQPADRQAPLPGTPARDARDGAAPRDAAAPQPARARAAHGVEAQAPAFTLDTRPATDAQPVATTGATTIDAQVDHVVASANDTRWLDQLTSDIARTGGADSRLSFKLEPANLGPIAVHIAQDADGASVRMSADHDRTRTILADAQPRLAAEARAQGLTLRETSVDVGGQDRGNAFTRHQAAFGGQSGGDDPSRRQQQSSPDQKTYPRMIAPNGAPASRGGDARYA